MSTDKPYSEQSLCPKCGSRHVAKQYQPITNRIRRVCVDCDYCWNELPKDYADTQKPQGFWSLLRPSQKPK